MSAKTEIRHGVFMEILGLGILIEGSHEVGKSALALELVSRGHKLIADDAPEFYRSSTSAVIGRCPPPLQDFIEVFGLGVLNIPAMFGTDAIKKNSPLRLLISLIAADRFKRVGDEYLTGRWRQQTVLDVAIPAVELPVMPGQNMAVIVECAARNHSLRMTGYNASEAFINRQRSFLEREE